MSEAPDLGKHCLPMPLNVPFVRHKVVKPVLRGHPKMVLNTGDTLIQGHLHYSLVQGIPEVAAKAGTPKYSDPKRRV